MEKIIECVKVTGWIQIITVQFDKNHQPVSDSTTWLKEGSKLYAKALKGIK